MNKKLVGGCLGLLGLIVVIAVIGVIYYTTTYNKLIRLSQGVDAQWAQVQNVYQRRADLIPNLVQTVSGVANFEKSTLTEVTDARASVGRVQINASSAPTDAQQLAAFDKAQGDISRALSRLMVVSENYPQLRATANFSELQAQLEGTENRISVERGKFNETVKGYNGTVLSFPANLLFSSKFPAKPYFAAQEGAATAPKVKFDFNKTPAPSVQPATPVR